MSVFRRVFGLLRQILASALDLAESGAASFSKAIDFALRPNKDSGHVAPARLVAWTFLNLLGILAVTLPVSGGFAPPDSVISAICGAGFLINLSVITSALLKLREDNDVVNGLVSEVSRKIKPSSAVSNHFVIANSILFLVLFLASGVQQVDLGLPMLLAKEPVPVTLTYGAYLLATLKALPISGAAVAVASWFSAREGAPLTMFIFGNPGGTIAEHAIFFIGSVFLVGLVALWLKQVRDTDRLIVQYLEAQGTERVYLQQRIKLSPLLIKPRILLAAVNPRGAAKQNVAIDAAVQLEIQEFPRDFCERFSEQRSKAVKRRGLEGALRIIDAQGAYFSDSLVLGTLSAAVHPLNRTKPRSERNTAFNWLAVKLMHRARSLTSLPKETIASLDGALAGLLVRRSTKDDDLQIAALEVALRHDFCDAIVSFAAKVDHHPKKVSADGVILIRQKIEREYGPSKLSSAIVGPLKKALGANLSDEVRALAEQLLQMAIAQNTPQPTLARRALGWIPGLRPPATVPAAIPAAVNAKPASSHAA